MHDSIEQSDKKSSTGFPDDTLASFGGLSPETERGVAASVEPKNDLLTRESHETWLDLDSFLREGSAKPESVQAPRYEMRRLLGKGGFAEVWESEQPALKRRVAIKRIRRDMEERARHEGVHLATIGVSFTLEALVTASLEHPNILPIYDLGYDENGYPMLAMKLLEDHPWDRQIKRDFNMPVREFLDKHLPILIDTAQAVAFAHSRGVVHRDIKPSQVLLGKYGEVLLTDWGLALVFDEEVYIDYTSPEFARLIPNRITATNPAGTLAFMAPEQTGEDCRDIGPWTDVYLLGGTLFYLLTGNVPHPEKDSRTAFSQAKSGVFPNPTEFFNERFIPPDLAEIARKALEKDPEDRYQTALEFVAALQDFISGTGRRKESVALSDEIAEEIESDPQDYVEVSSLLNKIDHSLNMWSDNFSAQCLRQELLTRLCTAALANNELILAESQAVRMDDWASRKEFIARIARKNRQVAAEKRRRGYMLYGVLALLVLSVFLTQYLLVMFLRSQERLGQAQDRVMLLEASQSHPSPPSEPAGSQ